MLVEVTNKSAGLVFYQTSSAHRRFQPQQTRKIELDELKELMDEPGGKELIANYLFIKNPSTAREVMEKEPEPEYWLTEDKIPEWMKTCSQEEFLDALDYAPLGVIDLIKKNAVNMPLNDFSKREAIHSKTGFDVTAAIAANAQDDDGKQEKKIISAAPTGRRTTSSIKVPEETRKVITK